jgi:ubiquinone biosynthesis accessory factor UbiJ
MAPDGTMDNLGSRVFETGSGMDGLNAWGVELREGVADRGVLFLNHLLMNEPLAMSRLAAQAGRRLRVVPTGLPAWSASWPPLDLEISAAGLLSRCVDSAGAPGLAAASPAPNLTLTIHVPDAARQIASVGRPGDAVQLQGDSDLAAEAAWLMQNLRWDIEADLTRVLPEAVAHQLVQAGGRFLDVLGRVRSKVADIAGR